jgi:hypothetical protein
MSKPVCKGQQENVVLKKIIENLKPGEVSGYEEQKGQEFFLSGKV